MDEYRLETVPAEDTGQVIEAMLDAHPYEEVVYDVYPLKNGDGTWARGDRNADRGGTLESL